MKIGSYTYIERNGIFRQEFVEDKADNPNGFCDLHYLLTNGRDRCSLHESDVNKGGILISVCSNCIYFKPFKCFR